MENYKIRTKGRDWDVECRKLLAAEARNYRNASTECGFVEMDCGVCPVNIALTENPMHTLHSLRSRVEEIMNERSESI